MQGHLIAGAGYLGQPTAYMQMASTSEGGLSRGRSFRQEPHLTPLALLLAPEPPGLPGAAGGPPGFPFAAGWICTAHAAPARAAAASEPVYEECTVSMTHSLYLSYIHAASAWQHCDDL